MDPESLEKSTVGPVDQQWLDQIGPWLRDGDLPGITVLPRRVTNATAVFSADTALSVKWLRNKGFDAGFLPTPNQTFESQYGADPGIVLGLVLNVASSAVWDGFKLLLDMVRLQAKELREAGAKPEARMVLGLVKHPDGSSFFWQDISGPAEEVLELAKSVARDYMSASPDGANATSEANGPSSDESS